MFSPAFKKFLLILLLLTVLIPVLLFGGPWLVFQFFKDTPGTFTGLGEIILSILIIAALLLISLVVLAIYAVVSYFKQPKK